MSEDLNQQVQDELARISALPASEQAEALDQLRAVLETALNDVEAAQ